jgi:hypothetical protein
MRLFTAVFCTDTYSVGTIVGKRWILTRWQNKDRLGIGTPIYDVNKDIRVIAAIYNTSEL